jgi:NADH:ubiquinone oxidoreductase subunit 5 (subunit L)/multisubunit Na+/H+ antiporter MnhA subunit
MLAPMAVLAGGCLLLGMAPGLLVPALERVTAVWAGDAVTLPPLASLAPFSWVSAGALAVTALGGALLFAVLPVCRRARSRQPALPTWDCGYAAEPAGSPRLQYTGSSFAELVTSRFGWVLRPHETLPRIDGHFPAPSAFHSHVDDTVLERLVRPRVGRIRQLAARLRASQHGNLQQYVLYMVTAIVLLLLFNLRFDSLVGVLCGR